jgi:hypothetical protein
MTRAKNNYAARRDDGQHSGELLILPDGRILAHNITPALARVLAELAPNDAGMRARAGLAPVAPEPTRSLPPPPPPHAPPP